MKKEVTKLYPVDSLNYVGRYGKAIASVKRDNKEEVKVVLLGKDHTARNAIRMFLEQNENFAQISALFIAGDDHVKLAIESLISQDEMAEQMSAVMVVKYDKTEDIIKEFIEESESVDDVRALLIVKDQNTKFAIEEMLHKNAISQEVKVVLVDGKNKAREVIMNLLGNTKSTSGIIVNIHEELDGESTQTMRIVVPELDENFEAKINNENPKIEDEPLEQSSSTMNPGTDSKLDFGSSTNQHTRPSPPFVKAELHLHKTNLTRVKELAEKVLGKDSTAAFINQGLVSEPPKRQHECQQDTAMARANILEMRIDTLVARLKAYLIVQNFDYSTFEMQAAKVDRQLSRLALAVTRSVACKPGLREKMAFARQMYDNMMDSIEFLKYYDGTNTPGHREISAIIDLNVRLLRFRDSNGEPDVTMGGFAESIRTEVQQMNFWANEFHENNALSFGKQKTFERFFSMAEMTLVNLGVNFAGTEEPYM